MDVSLDAGSERRLVERWRSRRDHAARRELVASHQQLVHCIARRFRANASTHADLVQEGNLGLLQAVDRFDPSRNTRLGSYASQWIKAYMLRFIERNSRIVRGATTTDRVRLFYRLSRTKQRLANDGKEVTPSAVAAALRVSEPDAVAMEQLQRREISLDQRLSSGPGGMTAMDQLVDGQPTPEAAFEYAEVGQRIATALDGFARTLHGRALEMFRERVATTRPASLEQLSKRWGVARATARRVEKRVAQPLRRHLYEELGDTIRLCLDDRWPAHPTNATISRNARRSTGCRPTKP